jgi:hypothetical protein
MPSCHDIASDALDRYNGPGIARAIVNLVPGGSSVDVLLTAAMETKFKTRMAQLVTEVSNRVDALDQDLVDAEFVRSEEFQTLLIRALEAMKTTHQRDKLAAFANVLVCCTLKANSDDVQKERYLLLLNELTSVHIAVLSQFREREAQLKKPNSQPILCAGDMAAQLGMNESDVEAFLSDLAARGLVYDAMLGSGEYRRGNYRLHNSANRFIDYLFTEWPAMPE